MDIRGVLRRREPCRLPLRLGSLTLVLSPAEGEGRERGSHDDQSMCGRNLWERAAASGTLFDSLDTPTHVKEFASAECDVSRSGVAVTTSVRPTTQPARLLPACALSVLGSLIVFSPLLEGGSTHVAVMIMRLHVLLLAVLAVPLVIRDGAAPRLLQGVSAPILVFLALAGISALTSPYTHQSVQWVLVLLSYAGLLYLIVFFLTRWNHILRLLAVAVAVGAGEAGYAVTQAWALGEIRPSGTFFNPNFLAGYLVAVAMPVLAALCYGKPRRGPGSGGGERRSQDGRRQSRLGWLGIVAGAALLVLLGVAVFETGSRGAALALVAGLTAVAGLRFGARGVAIGLLMVCVGLLVPNPLQERVHAEHRKNPVGYARWQMWQQAAAASADHPWGVGLGLYRYVSPRYAVETDGEIARYGKVARTPHNEYLQMAVELGFAGPAVFLWGVVLLGREGLRALRLRLRRRERGMVVGAVAGVVVLLVHAAVDSNLHEPPLALMLALFAGVLLAARRLGDRRYEPRSFPLRHGWVWGVASAVALVVLAGVILRFGLSWMAYEAGSRAQRNQDFETATLRYEQAIGLDPGKSLYHNALAAVRFQAFRASHDPADARGALEELNRAIGLNPLDGGLYGVLGNLHLQLLAALPDGTAYEGERDALRRDALLAYRRAAELEPYSPFHRLALGQVLLAMGDGDGAAAAVRAAVALEPNFLPGRLWLAGHYLASGHDRGRTLAREQYREIVERQARYAGRPKNHYERQLLEADSSRLAKVLEEETAT